MSFKAEIFLYSGLRSAVAKWYSATLEIEGLLVRTSSEALHCVLEKDTLPSA